MNELVNKICFYWIDYKTYIWMSLESRNIPSIFGPLPVAAEPTMIPLSFCLGTQDGSAFRNCNNYTILLKFESNHLWEIELTVWLNSLRFEWFEKTRWFWWLCFASVKSGDGAARLYNVRFAAEEKGLPSDILRRDVIARALFQKENSWFLKIFSFARYQHAVSARKKRVAWISCPCLTWGQTSWVPPKNDSGGDKMYMNSI